MKSLDDNFSTSQNLTWCIGIVPGTVRWIRHSQKICFALPLQSFSSCCLFPAIHGTLFCFCTVWLSFTVHLYICCAAGHSHNFILLLRFVSFVACNSWMASGAQLNAVSVLKLVYVIMTFSVILTQIKWTLRSYNDWEVPRIFITCFTFKLA